MNNNILGVPREGNHLAKKRFLGHLVYGDSKDLYQLVWSMDVHKTGTMESDLINSKPDD